MADEPRWVKVARVGDLRPGTVRTVQAEGRRYALANVGGTFYAVDNNCPHNGGPLGKGRLIGTVVECPPHQWRWDVSTGRCAWPDAHWRVARFPVRVENGDVLLGLL